MSTEKYLKYETGKIPLGAVNLIDPDILIDYLNNRIEKRLKLPGDIKLADELMNYVGHKNNIIEDYMYQILDVDESNSVLSRISFREYDYKTIPFVSIVLKNFDIIGYNNIKSMLKTILDKYKNFKPEFIEFFEVNEISNGSPFEKTDNFVIGHINSIKHQTKPDRYSEISLEKMSDLDFFDKYAEEYNTATNENVMFKYENIISKEDFEFYLSKGIVYKIIINEKYAGIYTVHKTQMCYLEGYYVIEKVLFKDYRGKKFAAAAERKAIDCIDAKDHEFIYGTIHPENKASLNTALKCGRYIGGSYYKLKFSNIISHE